MSDNETPSTSNDAEFYRRRHMIFGWWVLLTFLTLGLVLEALHAYKLQWYVNVGNETRRLMMTLAHTHGTLLGVLNIVFALTVTHLPESAAGLRRFASPLLMAAAILMPFGFLIGGIWIYSGDPGLGAWLVAPGGLLLLLAVLLIAVAMTRPPTSDGS